MSFIIFHITISYFINYKLYSRLKYLNSIQFCQAYAFARRQCLSVTQVTGKKHISFMISNLGWWYWKNKILIYLCEFVGELNGVHLSLVRQTITWSTQRLYFVLHRPMTEKWRWDMDPLLIITMVHFFKHMSANQHWFCIYTVSQSALVLHLFLINISTQLGYMKE